MTYPFTAADIANMSEAQGLHAYTDIGVYIPTADLTTLDDYGQPTPSTDEITMQCAFVDNAKAEQWQGVDIEQLEAEVYFSAVTPTKGGKVKILRRFGVDVTNKTFEIIGIQNRGAFGFVCALKVVTI